MVQKSASTRPLKTALDIIYAGTNFQKSEMRAARGRCKNAGAFGGTFGKAEGGLICNPSFKDQPACQIPMLTRRANM